MAYQNTIVIPHWHENLRIDAELLRELRELYDAHNLLLRSCDPLTRYVLDDAAVEHLRAVIREYEQRKADAENRSNKGIQK